MRTPADTIRDWVVALYEQGACPHSHLNEARAEDFMGANYATCSDCRAQILGA